MDLSHLSSPRGCALTWTTVKTNSSTRLGAALASWCQPWHLSWLELACDLVSNPSHQQGAAASSLCSGAHGMECSALSDPAFDSILYSKVWQRRVPLRLVSLAKVGLLCTCQASRLSSCVLHLGPTPEGGVRISNDSIRIGW